MTMPSTITWIDADDNRYPLTFDAGAGLQVAAIGLDAAPIEVRSDERAVDGSAFSAARAPSKTVALPILFEDRDLMDEMAETFIGRSSTLEVTTGTRVRELIDVYYVAGLEGDGGRDYKVWSDDLGTWKYQFDRTIELTALDPFWYGPSEWVALGVPETPDAYDLALAYDLPAPYDGPRAGISSGTPYDQVLAYDQPRPYDGGVNVSFGLTSKLGAWPVITVNGPASSFQVVHLRTGQLVSMRTGVTLGNDAKLVIDARPTTRSVRRDGHLAWQVVTPDSDPAMAIVAGDELSFIVGGTDAGSYVTVEWRQRWRMP